MLNRIHQKLGTAGFIISIVALVAALGGGAYAASGGLNGKQKKEVEKIAKKYAGKPGAPGANGTNGTNGANGIGAEGKQGPEGKPGKQGDAGSPWTAGGTLPSGQTETGAWGVSAGSGGQTAFAPLSFTIPLAAAPTSLVYMEVGEAPTTECPGTAEAPKAAKGIVCMYAETEEMSTFAQFGPFPRIYASGADPLFSLLGGGLAFGTWAVTAP